MFGKEEGRSICLVCQSQQTSNSMAKDQEIFRTHLQIHFQDQGAEISDLSSHRNKKTDRGKQFVEIGAHGCG